MEEVREMNRYGEIRCMLRQLGMGEEEEENGEIKIIGR